MYKDFKQPQQISEEKNWSINLKLEDYTEYKNINALPGSLGQM